MWIFWIHASNVARFEESYRTIADRIKLPRPDEPLADIPQLVSNWLRDEANGRWNMILDNVNDPTVFSDPWKVRCKSDLVYFTVSLSAFLPQSSNKSILVTSRNGNAASRLIGNHHDMIKAEPMDEDRALILLGKEIRSECYKDNATELLRALDYMPLAISQAAAYISQRAPGTTVARYLDEFRSDRNQENLPNRDAREFRRNTKASNSIITVTGMRRHWGMSTPTHGPASAI